MKRKRYPRALRERQKLNSFLKAAPAVAEAFKKYAAGMHEFIRALNELKHDWPICIKQINLGLGYGFGPRRAIAALRAQRMKHGN